MVVYHPCRSGNASQKGEQRRLHGSGGCVRERGHPDWRRRGREQQGLRGGRSVHMEHEMPVLDARRRPQWPMDTRDGGRVAVAAEISSLSHDCVGLGCDVWRKPGHCYDTAPEAAVPMLETMSACSADPVRLKAEMPRGPRGDGRGGAGQLRAAPRDRTDARLKGSSRREQGVSRCHYVKHDGWSGSIMAQRWLLLCAGIGQELGRSPQCCDAPPALRRDQRRGPLAVLLMSPAGEQKRRCLDQADVGRPKDISDGVLLGGSAARSYRNNWLRRGALQHMRRTFRLSVPSGRERRAAQLLPAA